MKLSADQIAAYDRDGFMVFPNLLNLDEVALLKNELARVGDIHDERVVRERSGGPRIVYGLHEQEGPTASRAYEALVRSPRILEPAKALLRDDVYVYHTKANTKMALDGAIYEWHQDYINWKMMDGPPEPRILTAMVMLDKSTELGGCLYFVPGSHKLGMVKPELNGLDMCREGPIWLAEASGPVGEIGVSVRIGITKEAHQLRRYFERGNPSVSGRTALNAKPIF